LRDTEATATRRFDHEYVASIHLRFVRCAELLASTVGTLYPIAPQRTGRAAAQTVGRNAPAAGKDGSSHRLKEAHAPNDAISAAMASPPPAGAPDCKRLQ
jgi:hypothetical protein